MNRKAATIDSNETTSVGGSFVSAWFSQPHRMELNRQPTQLRPLPQQPLPKSLSVSQKIELVVLSWILVEHAFVFLLTFRKKVKRKRLRDVKDAQQPRSVIFSSKSLLYNCLHRNWIRAYSFSNVSLSVVYAIILLLKHFYPNLLHSSSITFYSLPLTLVQQILINFSTFHLFIISISILQYFIRYYRLFQKNYSLNIYSGRNLLITKHTNVALILSGSLALIFAYNFIFYTPKHSQTLTLLPLITLNRILLPLIDCLILIFLIICWLINVRRSRSLTEDDLPLAEPQASSNDLRSTIERHSCIKCYSKFLQNNRGLLQDNDPYTSLHSTFFSQNLISSTRPSLTPPDEKRKYSTISYENIPMINDIHSRLRASYPCQNTRSYAINKSNYSHPDFSVETRQTDVRQNSANDLLIQSTLLKLKQQRSLCHVCFRLLLFFLLKYALFTFPLHLHEMLIYLRQFHHYILKPASSSSSKSAKPLTEHSEWMAAWCRYLFLAARLGDSLLLTRLPHLIEKYFPCWCQFNWPSVQRQSHQVLMKNIDSPTSEPLPGLENIANDSNDPPLIDESQRGRSSTIQTISPKQRHRHFRLRFEFMPFWAKNRSRLVQDHS